MSASLVPRNIEIKVRIADLASARAVCARLGARPLGAEVQTDRYYAIDATRRLKLRTVSGRSAELIEYRRPETAGVRASDYSITPVRDAAAGVCLVPSGPPVVVVRKRREVLLWHNVRIHLDAVDGLGTFLELEAVVDERHDDAACRARVAELMDAFALRESDLIAASYADLVSES
jgi:adenylate cyclase class IV